MKNYRSLGVTNPVLYGAGTALTFGKQLSRLRAGEHTERGTSTLFRGVRDGRAIARDASWKPMPPLADAAVGDQPAL